jgi:hypothetical protein
MALFVLFAASAGAGLVSANFIVIDRLLMAVAGIIAAHKL